MIKFKSLESLGILFAVLAYFSFSLLDAVQKTAVIYHSVFQCMNYFNSDMRTNLKYSRVFFNAQHETILLSES